MISYFYQNEFWLAHYIIFFLDFDFFSYSDVYTCFLSSEFMNISFIWVFKSIFEWIINRLVGQEFREQIQICIEKFKELIDKVGCGNQTLENLLYDNSQKLLVEPINDA